MQARPETVQHTRMERAKDAVRGLFTSNGGPLVEVAMGGLRRGNFGPDSLYIKRILNRGTVNAMVMALRMGLSETHQDAMADGLRKQYLKAREYAVAQAQFLFIVASTYVMANVGVKKESIETATSLRKERIVDSCIELLDGGSVTSKKARETIEQIVRMHSSFSA